MTKEDMTDISTVVVTRHSALIELLKEMGLVDDGVQVIAHATADDVRGRHVIGVLPLSLAVEAAMVTEIPLDIPQELRGKELTIEQLRLYSSDSRTYVVRKYNNTTMKDSDMNEPVSNADEFDRLKHFLHEYVSTNGVVPQKPIDGMSYERYVSLMWGTENIELTDAEIADGWHFCHDWDGLLIHPKHPEYNSCVCLGQEKFKKKG